ncbi:MAG: protein-export chaperone SecB [Pseudomonadota bacterium]
MTDQSAPPAPTLRALSQFVKDLSFENPASQLPEGQPNIDIGIDVSAAPRDGGQGVYETSLKMKARAHIGEATLFLMELDYCGLFQVVGLGEEETEAALLIECPRMLFPFARRLVADVTREGGFPPLLIDPVDFVQLYRQQKQRQSAAVSTEPIPTPAPQTVATDVAPVAAPATTQVAPAATPAPPAPIPAPIPSPTPAEAKPAAPEPASAPSPTLAPEPAPASPQPIPPIQTQPTETPSLSPHTPSPDKPQMGDT